MRILVPLSPKERLRGADSPYLLALAAAGAAPAEVQPLAAGDPLPASFDGLLLTGGADVDPARYGEPNRLSKTDPARDAMDFALIEQALQARVPVFAICRGLQALNVALGGTLYQDVMEDGATMRSHRTAERALPVHGLAATGAHSLLDSLLALPCPVNSLHHQAVRAVAPTLHVVARAPEDGIVEALEPAFPYPWLLAVQWHPEELRDHPGQLRLFEAFLTACRQEK